jgi:plastocyanin
METQHTRSVASANPRHGWRPALVAATFAQIVLNAALMAVSGEAVPALIVILGLLLIGLLLLGARERVGAGVLGVISLFHLATSGRFLAEGLVHAESFWDFWLGWSILLVGALGILAAIAVWAHKDDGGKRARVASLLVAGVVVTLGIVSGVATAAYDSDAAQSGDIMIAARNVEFEPADVSAEGGDIAVFVDNRDPVRHTFSIDELDVDVELPGRKAVRVEFSAEPGSYEFYCAVPGHEDMRGELLIK